MKVGITFPHTYPAPDSVFAALIQDVPVQVHEIAGSTVGEVDEVEEGDDLNVESGRKEADFYHHELLLPLCVDDGGCLDI